MPDVFDPILDASQSFLGVEDDHNSIESKIDSIPLYDKEDKTEVEEDSEGFNFLPILVGGVAAAALGVSAYLASKPEQINVDAKESRRQGRLLNHKSAGSGPHPKMHQLPTTALPNCICLDHSLPSAHLFGNHLCVY